MGAIRWHHALDAFHEAHEEILLNADARSTAFVTIDEEPEARDHRWRVHQIFLDSDDDRDFGIMAEVDLDATQEEGEAVFVNYRVGFIEELLDQA